MKNYIKLVFGNKKEYEAENALMDWLVKNPEFYKKAMKRWNKGYKEGLKLRKIYDRPQK